LHWHPSPWSKLPSSHGSPLTRSPSPGSGRQLESKKPFCVDPGLQTAHMPWHSKPHSTMQEEEQPSPSTVLLSSHVSFEWTTPSPHCCAPGHNATTLPSPSPSAAATNSSPPPAPRRRMRRRPSPLPSGVTIALARKRGAFPAPPLRRRSFIDDSCGRAVEFFTPDREAPPAGGGTGDSWSHPSHAGRCRWFGAWGN